MTMAARSSLLGISLLLAAACGGEPERPAQAPPATTISEPAPIVALPGEAAEPAIEPVLFELYVMSQCPYAIQAERALAPVVKALGPSLDLRIDFIGDAGKTGLTTMHGPRELTGDLVEICAIKHSPRWFDLVLCLDEDAKNIDTRWEACAEELGIPVGRIAECVGSSEGARLLAASFERSKARGARGSPTLFVAGTRYEGGRRGRQFLQAACDAFSGEKPDTCLHIPEAPAVDVKLLTDGRCSECDVEPLQKQLRARIDNPRITVLDYGDAAGRALFDRIGPAKLPAAVFDKSLDADEEAAKVFARNIVTVGDLRVVALGGKWRPECADSCQNKGCADTLQCRAEKPMRLELFVMSHCPFAAKGMAALQSVLDNLETQGKTFDLTIRYIGDEEGQGFKSMHGPAEVEEDLRQVCAIAHYKKKRAYLDYIWCRNEDYKNGDWRACTGKATGVSADVLAKCAEGEEGKRLLAASFATSRELGMGASPSWIVNGRHTFSGINPDKIQTAICAHNKLAGCSVTLSSEVPAAGDAWPRAKKAPQPAPAPRPAPAPAPPAVTPPPAVAPPQPGCSEDTAASTCGG
jgi:2-hydroxychromene-2-carboxylate isomerase